MDKKRHLGMVESSETNIIQKAEEEAAEQGAPQVKKIKVLDSNGEVVAPGK